MIKHKLTHTFFFVALFSAILAGIIAISFLKISVIYVDSRYDDPAYLEEKNSAYITKIQNYIDQHKIRFNQLYKLQSWLDTQVVNNFTLYDEKGLVYDSYQPFIAGEGSTFHSQKPLPWKTLYPITIDAKEYRIEASLFLKHKAMDIVHLSTLVIFFASFVLSMLIFIRKKTKYVLQLNQEIQQVEQGDIAQEITVYGEDELAHLAINVENMRKAFVDRLRKLDDYHQQSTAFVSSTSHDLKAPLATIIGYLDLVLQYELDNPKLSRLYLQRALDKAYHLKKLSNDLMDFFVEAQHPSSTSKPQIDKKSFETLLIQEVLDLESKGFDVQLSFVTDTQYYLFFDLEAMRRVFNNVFHNITLYADSSKPIRLNLSVTQSHLNLKVENHKRSLETDKGDGIGLLNCENFMKEWDGSFNTHETKLTFTLTLGFKLG